MAAIDAELGPHKIIWHPEKLSRNGTPIVDGISTIGSPYPLLITLTGPGDNLVSIESAAGPARSVDEAGLALAVLRASVPAAEEWFQASFAQPLGFPKETFGPLSVGWARDVEWLHGAHLSRLVVSSVPLTPARTPAPTRSPSPTSTETRDPVNLLPATVSGISMQRTHMDVAALPDDYPACLPLCRREVEAFAKRLGVEATSLYVAIARPNRDGSSSVAVAIIRVPRPAFASQFDWIESQKTLWPGQVLFAAPTAEGVFPPYLVAHHQIPPETGPATAWYLRGIDDLLIIVSDTASGPLRSPASEAGLDAFRQMP